jgi:dephospho-CoA kinase
MFLIGLTGGIAAGKSTVGEFWRQLGAIEIDADQLAREAISPGSDGLAAVIETFGKEVLDPNGGLDRSKLGQIVFSNPELRSKLEGIVHPRVRQLALEKINALSENSMVVYNVPLLVEANVDLPFDVVVTVEAPEETRIKRLVETRGMSVQEATNRVNSQAKPIERAARADYILNSNQSLGELEADAKALWFEFVERAKKK